MSGSPTIVQNFITIRSGVFDPRIREIVFTRLLFFVFFRFFVCGFFRQASAETAARILTLNTSNGVVSRKDVPFGGPVNDAPHLWGQIPKKTFQNGRE